MLAQPEHGASPVGLRVAPHFYDTEDEVVSAVRAVREILDTREHERFLSGELHAKTSGVVFFLGEREPKGHRYPEPAEKNPIDPDDIPW